MHTQNETDVIERQEAARIINEIENLMLELRENADFEDWGDRCAIGDFCDAVESAISGCVSHFGHESALDFFEAEENEDEEESE